MSLTHIKQTIEELCPDYTTDQQETLAERQHQLNQAMREECPEAMSIWRIQKACESRSPSDVPF
tara:strand:- start:718 stop:909 length:192 start_codon:yes stop_codon:yes gene_type:complete